MSARDEGVNRLQVQVVHYPASKPGSNTPERAMVMVVLYPADKPDVAERLATQNFLHAVKRVQGVAKKRAR
jgi:hypothetical protein